MSRSKKVEAQKAAVKAAIASIGLGYDLAEDLKLKYCKRSSKLIVIDDDHVRDLVIPAGISVRKVPNSINCDKGDRLRLASDVLSFQQVLNTITQLFFSFFFFLQNWFKFGYSFDKVVENYHSYEHFNSEKCESFFFFLRGGVFHGRFYFCFNFVGSSNGITLLILF